MPEWIIVVYTIFNFYGTIYGLNCDVGHCWLELNECLCSHWKGPCVYYDCVGDEKHDLRIQTQCTLIINTINTINTPQFRHDPNFDGYTVQIHPENECCGAGPYSDYIACVEECKQCEYGGSPQGCTNWYNYCYNRCREEHDCD